MQKSKVNSKFLSKYKEILIYIWRDKSNLNIYVQILFHWQKDVIKKKFNQINKEIKLNCVVKKQVWENNIYKLIGSYYFIDNG